MYFSLIMFGFLLNSCNNDSTSELTYSVSITELGPYQQVNVDDGS
jgi:hypothetical protein